MEEQIYDCITNSAKKRFDYQSFQDSLDSYSDISLFMILTHLANGDSPQIAALKLKSQFILAGYIIEESAIEKIILDNQDKWKKEIGVMKMATDMLYSGFASDMQVYDFVEKMLSE